MSDFSDYFGGDLEGGRMRVARPMRRRRVSRPKRRTMRGGDIFGAGIYGGDIFGGKKPVKKRATRVGNPYTQFVKANYQKAKRDLVRKGIDPTPQMVMKLVARMWHGSAQKKKRMGC